MNPVWTEGPRHVLLQLQLIAKQSAEVIQAALPTAMRSAWFAHSEMVLQTLLCSDDKEERRFAINKILEVREVHGNKEEGDLSVRSRHTPEVNPNASNLSELINWTNVHEPYLTCRLSQTELLTLLGTPMTVPQWPCHGQSIERCVKNVTEAAATVSTSC